ncbi:MAG: DUF3422 domain-containing protein [Burkholderiaceae bacterium]|nr:DUF3422 domain-containing protein [Burkholderiaceae bacterium]
MPIFPPNHAERYAMAEEVHARPPETLVAPARASYVAVLIDSDDRVRELAHLEALCKSFAVPLPPSGATHFRASLGALRLKWERHGEFSGYLIIAPGAAALPFVEPAATLMPAEWLSSVPGRTIAAAHVDVIGGQGMAFDAAALTEHFGGHGVAGSSIAEGAGAVYTDFRIHADGFSRWLVLDHGLTQGQAGRTLQRLVEIEAYRSLALLALPIARRQTPRMLAIERELALLTDGLAQGQGNDEDLLHQLTRLAAEVESGLAASQFRFGACRAYFELVTRRIAEMREARLPGLQTIEEFMARRFTPAVATCQTAEARLHGLSERIARASALLSTRVDIARERQNQALLASMDRRARLQLRLQQTVEGLSVAAIVYYLAGLVGYLAKGIKAGGWRFEPDLIVGIAVPALAVVAFMAVRRARRHAAEREKVN